MDDRGKRQTKVIEKLRLRKVYYQDEKDRYYEFLTNRLTARLLMTVIQKKAQTK